ncbi:asparagine synthase-related protein [Methanobrevibacter filiformis]|uniref:Putative asparagine synthetase [glutamine-hydrolyzing] n=1 Tax=Methanobrevibacter filiformis TaxID=55758 RepID=A0A166FE39_9EURY|nr:asparagine synthase-related protein [Methanobrevibacter filiformis]KZX17580.1 asparagine synthetase B [Methanobrevibacter filiformis]
MSNITFFKDNFLGINPIEFKNLKLSFIGEIYNHKELNDILNENSPYDYYLKGELLLKLIDYFQERFNNFLIAIENVISLLNGDFAFSVTDGENLAISRDYLGSIILFYGLVNDENGVKEYIFSQNRKDIWKLGIEEETLKPGTIFYNGKIMPIENPIWNFTDENVLNNIDNTNNYIDNINNTNNNFYKENLKKLLFDGVLRRIEGVKHVGLIFSGGVDSTIIAKILKNLSNIHDFKLTLYTIGTKNSQDLEFSKKVANDLNLDLKYQIIDEIAIKNDLEDVLITMEKANIVKIGVGLAIHFATKLAQNDGVHVVLTGQGADELFGGYHRNLEIFKEGYDNLSKAIRFDIENMHHVNLERDVAIATNNNVQLRSPFLDKNFIEFALNVPGEYKVKSSDDNLRKHILREIAIDLDIPEYVVYRPKKAAQYGSGIHKLLSKKIIPIFNWKRFLDDFKKNQLN